MYYLLFLYLVLLLFLSSKIEKKNLIIYTFVPLLAVIWLRYGVGADYFSYMRIYNNIGSMNLSNIFTVHTNIDILFKLIAYIPAHIGISYHVFSSLLITLSTGLVIYWISQFPIKFEISLLLYVSMLFFYWNLSALRQGLVVFVSLYEYFNGSKEFDLKTKLLTTLVMMFMHKSAIIVPVIYLLSNLKWKRNSFILLLALSPLSRMLIPMGIIDVVAKIPLLNNITRYMDYNSISYFSAPSIMRLFFIFLVLFSYDKLNKKFPKYRTMLNFCLVSLIGYFYLPLPMVIGTRTTIFGYFLLVLIIPMIYEVYSDKVPALSILAVLGIASLSFTNEYSKLVARTGYVNNPHLLNFETVSNGDFNDFSTNFSLRYAIEEDQKDWYLGTDLEKKVNLDYSKEAVEFNPDSQFFTVLFPFNNRYGIISDDGKLAFNYFYSGHRDIIKNYRIMSYQSGPFDIVSYEDFSVFPSVFYEYSEVEDEILYELTMLNKNKYNGVIKEELTLEYLYTFDILSKYNLESVVRVEKFSYSGDEDVAYVRFLTETDAYYLLLQNDELMVDRIYSNIEVKNYKNIIVAETSTTREYINDDGIVIWYELKDE